MVSALWGWNFTVIRMLGNNLSSGPDRSRFISVEEATSFDGEETGPKVGKSEL
jgi:hypothetical protein